MTEQLPRTGTIRWDLLAERPGARTLRTPKCCAAPQPDLGPPRHAGFYRSWLLVCRACGAQLAKLAYLAPSEGA